MAFKTDEISVPDNSSTQNQSIHSLTEKEEEERSQSLDYDGETNSKNEKPSPDLESGQNLTKSSTNKSEKPYTAFPKYQVWFIVAMASAASFFSPLSGQIYFPVLPILTKNYHLTPALLNVSVTTYMIFQGLAPSFMGTFSDASGRRPAYILAFTIYTAANIGLALQNSYAALLVLRCLQSAGSSGTVSFGFAVVADVVTTAERGKYMGPMASGIMLGPALGPVIGGLLAQFLGWRAVFWFLVIISGSFLAVYAVFQPETHRKIVGDGSVTPAQGWRLSLVQYIAAKRKVARMSVEEKQEYEQTQIELKEQQRARKLAFPNPLKSFAILLQLDAFTVILYSGLMMFGNLVLVTATPTLFPGIYGLNELEVGLCFLPLGVAAAIGSIVNGKLLDWNYRRLAAKHGMAIERKRNQDLTEFPIEKARLQMVIGFASVSALLFLTYGWALQYHAHLAVPMVIQFLIGGCIVCTSNSLSTLLADIFPGQVATASAAQNLLRCWLGAVGAAVVDSMLSGMGTGWCFTFTALVLLAGVGLLWVEMEWGMGWRQKRWAREKAKKEVASS
ncbi:putative transporter AQR1 [Talaromyces islandicus]|uniref:Putative transporter AQR1 n=1 Tax=Talaromyces islandicus TaxID=28573 RepID=A0A0U1M9A1_TALIS|nr:putative transporter AQR1 [Talaromyces islandicus]